MGTLLLFGAAFFILFLICSGLALDFDGVSVPYVLSVVFSGLCVVSFVAALAIAVIQAF